MDQSKKMMKAVYLKAFDKPVETKEIAIPTPKSGQVLIKVEAAPINPSDLLFLKGKYSSDINLPCVPGFEGSGVVVENGGGLIGWNLVGKRVAFSSMTGWGSYAEYCIADAYSVMTIPADISFNEAGCTFINPLTVIAMLETVKDAKVKAIVHTAAASSLGKMMVRYFQDNGVTVIGIVRRDEQIDTLKKEGADIVFNQEDSDFEEKLKAKCQELNATILFESVAGELTGKILNCMPDESTAYVYGLLSDEKCKIEPIDLVFKKKHVTGFLMTDWLKKKNLVQLMLIMNKIKSLLKTQLKSEIANEVSLEDPQTTFEKYSDNMSKGKIIFKPQKNQQDLKSTSE